MAVTNTLAYYCSETITALKSYIIEASGLMLFIRPRTYIRMKHLKGTTLANMRLGWKGMLGTNNLAFYQTIINHGH
jgi:hypothetical protein